MNHCAQARATADNASWTRSWALRCEARLLAALPLSARREYLEAPLVRLRVAALKSELEAIWRER